jgi:hypothetical protein
MYGALRADPGSLEFMTNCLQQGALRRMIDESNSGQCKTLLQVLGKQMANPQDSARVARLTLSYSRSCDLISFAVQFLHGGAASWAGEEPYLLEKKSLIACQIARGTGAPALLG